ncbi:OLC1v1010117C1 [Oldenlandia corymbosa var. corymbosa]|uniref:OLC1v1010117C1 n=1 Tax=Oldenlandia corymbosa var. corymbosa TaxID=529605 RepID=A0AAV1DQR6_OLDCO|nr:OLC1v1010117C1 [Oldenlandia corymbosa var. corymbosa]
MGKSETAENRDVIQISSSSSSALSSSSGEEFLEESDSQSDDSSDCSVEEISSGSCSDDAENDDDDADGGGEIEGDDEECLSNRVSNLLRERSDIGGLTLVECKAYLRRHGLRLSGTRVECLQRIKEHWRIRDGRGVILYPRSSFNIDCTGDVCRGDVVLFTQKVFDKVTRSGRVLGRRTVAGRIIKESYGAAKQQHTFTVEVLWSKGIKELPPLVPLLVKGRNLYRMKTFRQSWKNEKERREVLAEKHQRGAAARQIREMRKTTGVKRKREKSSSKEVFKYQKHSRRSHVSETSRRATSKLGNHHDGRVKAPIGKQRSFRQSNVGGNRKFLAPLSRSKHQNHDHRSNTVESSVQSYDYPRNFHLFRLERYHQEPPSFVP